MKKIIIFSILLIGIFGLGVNIEFDYYIQDTKVGTATMNFDEQAMTGSSKSLINVQNQKIKTVSKTEFNESYIFTNYNVKLEVDDVQRIDLSSKFDGTTIKNQFNGVNLPKIETENNVHIIDNGFIIEHIYALTKITDFAENSYIPQLSLSNRETIFNFKSNKENNIQKINYANVELKIIFEDSQIKSIEIPAQGAKLLNTNFVSEKSNAKNYKEKEISFNSNDLEISGTLITPNKPKNKIFVFVHGSGANDRDETLREGNVVLKPFKDLAEDLAEKGYSSFRYDKRSYLYLTRNIDKDIDPIEFVSDAKNAFNFINNNFEYNEIILLGHSQGASFVPLINDNNFDRAIAISPGTEKFVEQMIYQIDYQINYFKKLNNSEQYKPTIDQLKKVKNQVMDIKQKIENNNYNPEEKVFGADYDFLVKSNELTSNTIEKFTKIEIPTLIINGTVDLKTPHEKLKEYEEELLKNKYITIKYIEGMGHMLNKVGSVEHSEKLSEEIVEWVEGE